MTSIIYKKETRFQVVDWKRVSRRLDEARRLHMEAVLFLR